MFQQALRKKVQRRDTHSSGDQAGCAYSTLRRVCDRKRAALRPEDADLLARLQGGKHAAPSPYLLNQKHQAAGTLGTGGAIHVENAEGAPQQGIVVQAGGTLEHHELPGLDESCLFG
jgi:hypothetical protein